jgi:hypothetical protein
MSALRILVPIKRVIDYAVSPPQSKSETIGRRPYSERAQHSTANGAFVLVLVLVLMLMPMLIHTLARVPTTSTLTNRN